MKCLQQSRQFLICSTFVSYLFAKSLSTLATIVADFGDNLSPKTATVAENGDCRRKVAGETTATGAEFGDCRRCLAVFCDSRRFRRQSHFSAQCEKGLTT